MRKDVYFLIVRKDRDRSIIGSVYSKDRQFGQRKVLRMW